MPASLLRPPTVRRLAELLRHLPVRERTTILAQAVCEGSMTRAGADQVMIAIRHGRVHGYPLPRFAPGLFRCRNDGAAN